MWMNKFLAKKKKSGLEFKKLSYDKNSQNVKLYAGMPIIARKNCKSLNIFNNETFTIKEIRQKENIMIIQDDDKCQEIPLDKFQQMFYVAFCLTIHKSQGATFDKPYTIHEFDKLDNTLKYVAMSRATKKQIINIV
jgi:ATP-dependent exoDNAse (exonuclease V) alpha subunit